MNRVAIIFKEKATEDLKNLWMFTFKNWSEAQANRYFNSIIEEINTLPVNPTKGKIIKLKGEIYKKLIVQSHFIFFKVFVNEIKIIRILHKNMDIPKRLKDI